MRRLALASAVAAVALWARSGGDTRRDRRDVAAGSPVDRVTDASLALAPIEAPGTAKFLVLTVPRSGSTWLVKWSAEFAARRSRFNEVVTAGEVLHATQVKKRSPAALGYAADASRLSVAEYLAYLRGTYALLARGFGWHGDVAHEVHEDADRFRADAALRARLAAAGVRRNLSDLAT